MYLVKVEANYCSWENEPTIYHVVAKVKNVTEKMVIIEPTPLIYGTRINKYLLDNVQNSNNNFYQYILCQEGEIELTVAVGCSLIRDKIIDVMGEIRERLDNLTVLTRGVEEYATEERDYTNI